MASQPGNQLENSNMQAQKGTSKKSLGTKIIIGAGILYNVVWLFTHFISFMNYEAPAGWGLPDEEFLPSGEVTNSSTVDSLAISDLFTLLMLGIPSIVGLWKDELYGSALAVLLCGANINRFYFIAVMWWTSKLEKPEGAGIFTEKAILFVNVGLSVWGAWSLYKRYLKVLGAPKQNTQNQAPSNALTVPGGH